MRRIGLSGLTNRMQRTPRLRLGCMPGVRGAGSLILGVDLMRTLTVIIALCCFALSGRSQTNEPPAIVKTLLDQGTKTASSDFAAACINLTRDVQDKRLSVYAVVSTAKTGVTNEAGFTIRVTYHRELEENNAGSGGSFIQHYNGCVLDFALAQYAEGKKALGLRLVRLLAEAAPETSWSSMRIQPTNINKILASLEADDGSLSDMLKEATRDWHQRERDYKP